jgi:hypothetical protein
VWYWWTTSQSTVHTTIWAFDMFASCVVYRKRIEGLIPTPNGTDSLKWISVITDVSFTTGNATAQHQFTSVTRYLRLQPQRVHVSCTRWDSHLSTECNARNRQRSWWSKSLSKILIIFLSPSFRCLSALPSPRSQTVTDTPVKLKSTRAARSCFIF